MDKTKELLELLAIDLEQTLANVVSNYHYLTLTNQDIIKSAFLALDNANAVLKYALMDED